MKRLKVEFFTSPGCTRCAQAKARLQTVLGELGQDRFEYHELNIVDELDYAVELGVLTPSAIALDGTLVFASMPSIKHFRKALLARL